MKYRHFAARLLTFDAAYGLRHAQDISFWKPNADDGLDYAITVRLLAN